MAIRHSQQLRTAGLPDAPGRQAGSILTRPRQNWKTAPHKDNDGNHGLGPSPSLAFLPEDTMSPTRDSNGESGSDGHPKTREPGKVSYFEHPSRMRGGDWAPGSGGSEVTDSTRQTPRESPPPLGWAPDQGGRGQFCRFQTNPLWSREPLQTDVPPGGSGTPHQTQRGCLERPPSPVEAIGIRTTGSAGARGFRR